MKKYILFVLILLTLFLHPASGQLGDNNQLIWGAGIFRANDGTWHRLLDYNSSFIYTGTYWATQSPTGLNARFYADGRIYLGQDVDHYIGFQPMGIYYIDYIDPTQKQLLVNLSGLTLAATNNVVTYTKGTVKIEFINSFREIKGNIYLPNTVPTPTVSNPALVIVWEIIDYQGINADDGERTSNWWFDNAKAAFPLGDITNNGTTSLKKKIFRQLDKIYLVEGVGYNWISDLNRTAPQFVIDPTIQWNYTSGWSGLTLNNWTVHGDNRLRQTSLIDDYVSYWSFEEQTGNTAYDMNQTNNNDGSFTAGNTGNWTSAGYHEGAINYDGVDDYVNAGNDASLNITTAITLEAWMYPVSLGVGGRIIDKSLNGFTFFVGNTNQLDIYITTAAGVYQERSSVNAFNLNNWSHVVATYNSSDAKIFVNGTEMGTTVINGNTGNIVSTTDNLGIGNRPALDRQFDGTIDEVRIYKYVLTPTQINQSRDNYYKTMSIVISSVQNMGVLNVLGYVNVFLGVFNEDYIGLVILCIILTFFGLLYTLYKERSA